MCKILAGNAAPMKSSLEDRKKREVEKKVYF